MQQIQILLNFQTDDLSRFPLKIQILVSLIEGCEISDKGLKHHKIYY